MKSCLKIVIAAVSVISSILTVLVFLGLVFSRDENIDTLLKSLPETERAALDAVCREAGIAPGQLRPLGITTDDLLRDARNARSLVIRDGHVRVLCLRDTSITRLPDIRAFTELESLWLETGRLNAWPELASLHKLTEIQLNGQPLGPPPSRCLPPQLKKLGLSGTKVGCIDTLTAFPLDEVDLSRTPIDRLPVAVPEAGQWRLNLDETPITRPPGYRTDFPSGTIVSGPALAGGKIDGMAGHRNVEVRITGSELKAVTTLVLPTNTTLYHSSGPVEVECRVARGRMRVWLQEPEDLFDGPWFKAGKIEGHRFAHRNGWLTTEVRSGTPATARGTLGVQGTPPGFSFFLTLEPIGEVPVGGIELLVRSVP